MHVGPSLTLTSSFVDLIRHQSLVRPGSIAFTFLTDGEVEGESLSYADLDARARDLAGRLQQQGDVSGQRTLLLFPPGLDFITAFLGCLYAGAVAVPAYPPRSGRAGDRTREGLRAIARDAGPKFVLTTAALESRRAAMIDQIPELRAALWEVTDGVDGSSAHRWVDPAVTPEGIAFLQYTSGSTGSPKGVVVSHGNLLHNEQMIQQAFGLSAEAVIVGWLPLYHDMGLIGNVLQPIHLGARCVLMSPSAFLQKPVRWLEAISRYRATVSGGPNFAYELCIRRVTAEQRERLNLSSWATAFSGAEPVRAATLERFLAEFGPQGFRREAFYPCYGLAEATLLVAGSIPGSVPLLEALEPEALESSRIVPARDAAGARWFVGCGRPWLGQRVVVVDPEERLECPPDRVGEIWVAGPSVAQGYWGLREETERDFRARLADTPDEGPFLRTGDLGFFARSHLFVTGRLKDLIIIRGRNHYPQDIELTAERSHPDLQPDGGAAFSVDREGEERLVVLHEVLRRRQADLDVAAVVGAVRQAVAELHEIQVHDVVLLQAGTLPRTSSGKVRRRASRDFYLLGELAVVVGLAATGRTTIDSTGAAAGENATSLAYSREALFEFPHEERGAVIAAHLRQAAGRAVGLPPERIEPDRPLTALGLDSLSAIELAHLLETTWGIPVSYARLLDGASLDGITTELLQGLTQLADDPPAPADVHDPAQPHPLSYGERALWFLEQLAPETTAFILASAARVVGELDVAALRRALEGVVARHPALRTVFGVRRGELWQRVHERVDVEWIEAETAGLDEAGFRRRLEELAFRPFDKENGPLLRFGVLRSAIGERVVFLAIHHLVSDLWSLGLLLGDLAALYRGEVAGETALLGPVGPPYADFVSWQERMLASEDGERLWEFWRQRLEELVVLDLPTDRARPLEQTTRGACLGLRLDPALTDVLKTLARAHRTTLYVTLLAVFKVLLYRHAGQDDIIVGSPTVGRSRPEFARTMGYFINPLVLRTDLSGGPAFSDLLGRVRGVVLEGFEHQDYPFPLLIERLRPERDPSRSPLFQVFFVMERAGVLHERGLSAFALGDAGARLELGDIFLESLRIGHRSSQFDLMLLLAEINGGLGLMLEYNPDLFDSATMQRLAGHYEVLLRAMSVDPRQGIDELPMLTAAEWAQLALEWNDPLTELPLGGSLHELFVDRARRYPKAVAAVLDLTEITYGWLDERSNQLAQRLRLLGVERGDLVGLCVERSLEMLVGILGILKAGAAYVPLDPSYPQERLLFVLGDALDRIGSPVLVTQERLTTLFSEKGMKPDSRGLLSRLHRVLLDADQQSLASESHARPIVPVTHDDLAYVIYTSGSTGWPKGVPVSHGQVVRLFAATQAWFGFGPKDVWSLFHSHAFDFSIWEIWGALLYGGRLVIVPYLASRSPEVFYDLLITEGVTVLNQTPTAFRQLVRLEEDGVTAGGLRLRLVILGGEALEFASLLPWLRRHPEHAPRLVNMYGITETTVHVTYRPIGSADLDGSGASLIGRPIPDLWIRLFGRDLELVPIGAVGEICVGGAGLARGYHGRPDLTAERFVPDPLSHQPGVRLYRSGDLARYRADGDLQYLGRLDHQVQLRGFRIELGEIEAVLSRHPDVREVAVMARTDTGGESRLVAYVVPRRDGLTISDLRQHLKERLPDYMVPAMFSLIESLPATPSGKVDRGALPDPGVSRPALHHVPVAPRTPLERELADIWCELLKLDWVGIYDNFFDLGGHSLIATQLASRLRDGLGVELPIARIFDKPTIADLAAMVDSGGASLAPTGVQQRITRQRRPETLPLSFAQERLWFLHHLSPDSGAFNMAGGARLTGRLGLTVLTASLSEIVRRHEAIRTNFVQVDGRPVQVVRPPGEIALPMIDLGELTSEQGTAELRRLAGDEAYRPFDLARDLLLRARVVRMAEDEHVVLLTMHHIVSDGWSMGILVREIGDLYGAFANGRPTPLPELPVQYADYTLWQRRWLQGDVLSRQLAYWRQQLSGVLPVLDLPMQLRRPARPRFRGAAQPVELPAGLYQELAELGQREGVTLFMTLLAGFKALLFLYTGQDDLLVGINVANRNRGEVEGLIGFFVNNLVLRTSLSGELRFRDLLARVRSVALAAYAHQDAPFEKTLEAVQPQRYGSFAPLFQVMFVFEKFPLLPRELPELDLIPLELESRRANFDLTLRMVESEDGLTGSLIYDIDLFDPVVVARMARHYTTLLEKVVVDPDQELSSIPIGLETDVERMINDFSEDA